MHNHVIAGDFGYLPVYSDEEGYTHKSEALEGLKNYVNSVVDSVEACGVEHDWDWQIVLSVELGTCNIHKVNDYLCQDCHENSRTIELDYIDDPAKCVHCANPETPDQYDKLQRTQTVEEFWLATGVVTGIGTDGCKDTIQVTFDRRLASIDYAEITLCYENCKSEE